MKTDFKSLKVDPDDISTIYRYHSDIIFKPDGSLKIEAYFQDVVAERLPYDGEVYMVPAIFRDVLCKEVRGFAVYETLFQTAALGYNINEDGSLSDIYESGLLDIENKIVIELLIQPEGFDAGVKGISEKMPDKVEWGDFYSENAYQNVGYAFKLVGSTAVDMDLDALRIRKELSGEIDPEDEMECTGVYRPDFVLHKVFLSSLPKVGHLFYIPVEINFNDKQQRKGYAFFDVQSQQVLDVHFYDKINGQVSAMFNTQRLENCGLFKDEKLFSYKILLSNC
ncbi:MAG: hypothetical protein IH620_07860 [Ignavibacterium sp.]|nr:hypothetical protein [Ignavibacterium sp.]